MKKKLLGSLLFSGIAIHMAVPVAFAEAMSNYEEVGMVAKQTNDSIVIDPVSDCFEAFAICGPKRPWTY